MAMTADVEMILADARLMQSAAVTLLNTGDLRDAADKAWCAAKRAADAIITANTGEEPRTSAATGRELRFLAQDNSEIAALRVRYRERLAFLHGDCFYYGDCEPIEEIIDLIRETDVFISDAERIASR